MCEPPAVSKRHAKKRQGRASSSWHALDFSLRRDWRSHALLLQQPLALPLFEQSALALSQPAFALSQPALDLSQPVFALSQAPPADLSHVPPLSLGQDPSAILGHAAQSAGVHAPIDPGAGLALLQPAMMTVVIASAKIVRNMFETPVWIRLVRGDD